MAMTDQQLSYLSVLTALNKMMAGKYFDICTVDTAAQALGTIPDGAAYKNGHRRTTRSGDAVAMEFAGGDGRGRRTAPPDRARRLDA